MAGGKDDPAVRIVLSYDAGSGGRREQPPLSHQYFGNPIGRRHAADDLTGLAVVIAAITTQHEDAPAQISLGIEDRLHKVFQIVRSLKNFDLFSQAGSARSLVRKGLSSNGGDFHCDLPSCVVEDSSYSTIASPGIRTPLMGND